jgi:hypothetical protein
MEKVRSWKTKITHTVFMCQTTSHCSGSKEYCTAQGTSRTTEDIDYSNRARVNIRCGQVVVLLTATFLVKVTILGASFLGVVS